MKFENSLGSVLCLLVLVACFLGPFVGFLPVPLAVLVGMVALSRFC